MKRWIITGLMLLAAPVPALAQTKQIQADIDKALHEARVYQDIEIMRRLMQRRVGNFASSCSKCHSDPLTGIHGTWMDRSASMGGDEGAPLDGPAQAANDFAFWVGMDGGKRAGRSTGSDAIVLDGHYLKGHGIILQGQLPASLSMHPRLPAAQSGKKSQPPVSEWDQIRKQLWGEKVEAATAPREDPHPTSVEEVLLQVLAENGKNFRSLAANEQLTLNLTFRIVPSGAPTILGDGPNRQTLRNWLTDRGGSTPNTAGGNLPASGGSQPSAGSNISFKDYELLADFHMKQGRYQEAVKTLQKALEVNKDATRASSLYRKLASAYLLQDAGQSNPQIFEKVAEFLKKAQESGKAAAAAPAQRLMLPTRLVITAPRAALQQASPGNLEEFRRQITATWLRFDHPVLEQKGETESGSGETTGR